MIFSILRRRALDNDIDLLVFADNLHWNLRNREIICSSRYDIRAKVVSTIGFLLKFNNDDVVREAINLVHELYDETSIFFSTEAVDQCDITLREKLMEFLSDGP